MRKAFPALGLLVLCAAPIAAQPSGFFIDTSLSQAIPSGTVSFGGPLTSRSLGAFTGGVAFQPRLRYLTDRFRIEVGYDRSTFSGSSTDEALLRTARAGLSPVIAVETVSSTYQSFSAGFRYDLYRTPTFSVGPGADVDFLSVRSTLRSFTTLSPDTSFLARDSSRTSPVPTLGANLHDRENRFFLDLKVGYAADGTDLAKGRAEAGYAFARYSGVKIGWEGLRYRDLRADSGIDLKVHSLSGGFFFRF